MPGTDARTVCQVVDTPTSGDEARSATLLDALDAGRELASYHLLPAARADLLRRLGRADHAATAYRLALALAPNDAERRYLERRLAELATR